MHKSKANARGFNQSELICQGMSEVLSTPIQKNISRISFTDTQTRKRRFDRWLNVSEKFVLSEPEILEGKRVLLVDDVLTTGATLEAAALPLLEVSGLKLSMATLAIAT